MPEYHLLYWVIKILNKDLTPQDFDAINAPEWVYPAYKEKCREWPSIKIS
jgi:hypothetical protein